MMADMAVAVEAMRLLTYKAAWLVDRGESPNAISSYAKLYSADACMKITTDAVQIFGGYGYMNDYPVREADARRQAAANLRGHVADPADGDRAKPA